jgi:hypothetical protein
MLARHASQTKINQWQKSFLNTYNKNVAKKHRQSVSRLLPYFKIRAAIDIIAITVINLGKDDKNRDYYVSSLLDQAEKFNESL